MAYRRFNQFFNTLHKKPVLLDCNFVVDNSNAAGITSLKGGGIQNVWMHTTTTPAVGNPNPAAGYAVVQFSDNYKTYFWGGGQIQSPNSGSNLLVASAGLTVGLPYVISVLGTTSLAQWQVLGVPVGITPAIGVVFIAKATSCTGTGAVQLAAAAGAGISSIDILGNPNQSINSSAAQVLGSSSGAYMILRFLAPSFSGSALGTHAHDLLIKGGQAASTTNDVAAYAGPILGKEQATDATIAGSASATNGGVLAASAGTPAGSVSFVAAAPAAGSIVRLAFYMTDSNVLVQGE